LQYTLRLKKTNLELFSESLRRATLSFMSYQVIARKMGARNFQGFSWTEHVTERWRTDQE